MSSQNNKRKTSDVTDSLTMNGETSRKPRTLKPQKLLKKAPEVVDTSDQKYIYTCQYCRVKFTQNSHYYRHISTNHSTQKKEATFQCDQCCIVFTKKATLDSHCRTQHKVKSRSRCDSCALTFKSRYCLRKHMKLKQLMRENTCPKCLKICIGKETLAKHLDNKHVTKNSYKCDQCILHFKRKQSLSCHMNRIHTIKRL